MSGELQVVFIYDTLRCRKEEDDPREAILYFHPEEISENRRMAICGQLMGITHFLIDAFSAPKILSLENGKFALKDFGRQYVLALGCSSVTPDWLLEKQADILYKLTRFFHKDIDSILTAVGMDRALLSAKLACIMDHYIPISQHHGDLFALTFGILPILNLPKSANHISLSATVTLQTCMLKDGVLGGMIMFQNKVIGVELKQELAQKLAFIQPYQLPPADPAKPKFPIPPGVQLLTVYIKRRDLMELRKHSSTYQFPSRFESNSNQNSNHNQNGKTIGKKGKINSIREEESDISLGFSSEPISIKKEVPKVFKSPNFPKFFYKEDEISCGAKNSDKATKNNAKSRKDEPAVDKKSKDLPAPCVHKTGCGSNFLHPLRLFKSLENLGHNLQEDDSEFSFSKKSFSSSLTDPFFPYIRCDGKNISKLLIESYANQDRSLDPEMEEESYVKDHKKPEEIPEMITVHEASESDCEEIPLELIKHGCAEATEALFTKLSLNSKKVDIFCDKNDKPKITKTEMSNFKPDFNLSAKSQQSRPKDLALNLTSSTKSKSKRRWSTFEDMMSPVMENPAPVPIIEIEMQVQPREKSASFCTSESDFLLKKLSKEESNDLARNKLLNSFRKLSSPSQSGQSQEEPLFSDSGKGSDNKDSTNPTNFALKPMNPLPPKLEDDQLNIYEEALLFIYSLGGMRLLLLLDKECLSNQELILSLREYGSSSVAELELAVSNVEEQSMSMGGGHHDHYCYLHYEAVWKSLAHGGRNHSMDFDVVQHMHQDFHVYPNINELIIRGDDHVVYGYQCVGSEVFYQQSAGQQPGLPMPSDLMGKVPLKARRRLERDHNILLL